MPLQKPWHIEANYRIQTGGTGVKSESLQTAVILHTTAYLHTPAAKSEENANLLSQSETCTKGQASKRCHSTDTLPLVHREKARARPQVLEHHVSVVPGPKESHTNTAISTRFIPFHPVSSRLFLSFSNVFLICLYLLAFFSSHLQNLILQVEVIEVSSPSSESPRPLLAQLQVPVALARGCWQRRPTSPWPVKCLAKAIIFSAYLSNIYPNVSGNWARLTKPTKLLQPW
jgi:hypothetical protein